MTAVILNENRGRFLKPCPGTPNHVCCGYQIIDFARGCNIGCSYCILTSYFGRQKPTIFKNKEKLFEELSSFLEGEQGIVRLGTGEFTDSLLFDDESGLYPRLIPNISKRKNSVLEIKTKTTRIRTLLEIPEHENTIVSWSLNSSQIAEKEERGAPPVAQRIEAAREIQRAGYRVAFHFDPIVVYEGWEDGYKKTVDLLFEKVDPARIVYISMGTLRFPPAMKRFIPRLAAGEFVQGADRKLRYFRPLRTRVYIRIKEYLKRGVEEDILYLCMESPYVWEDVFGISMTSEKLKERLDRACINQFRRLLSLKIM